MTAPIRFEPRLERLEDDEAATEAAIVETLRGISETTLKDGGRPLRSVHAKSHGLLQAELRVLPNLPPELAQGLFTHPATYPAVMRLSTSPGDDLADSVSSPRGVGIKTIGAPGERMPGAEGATQDFVMVDGPAFTAATARAFLRNLKLLAATTDRAEGLKKVLSAALRSLESVVESLSGPSGTIKSLGGQPAVHILGETFFTQTPILWGRYIAKVCLAPISPALTALTGTAVDLGAERDILRQLVRDFFAAQDGEWELRAQLCTDPETMPIEDPTVPWPEDASPYRPVARVRVGPQPSWTPARAAIVDDCLSFSPWHGLAAHRPLGAINRVRREAYRASAQFRTERNGCPMHEPADAILPG